ncbi:MAG TPA: type IV secretion system protein [Micropepsaceae bacterium]|nr:type IV secretion system protein [Micropepsaceae bacterium]
MAVGCVLGSDDAGLVLGLTQTVDCNVQTLVRSGYAALSGSGSPVVTALTILLTIYIALAGFRLMIGRSPLTTGEMTVAALKIGIVVTLATSWSTYQQIVFDTLVHGPEQLGALMLQNLTGSGGDLQSGPYTDLQNAYDELQRGAAFFSQHGTPVASPLQGGPAFAALALNLSALMMMMTTLGLLLTAKIILALLLAAGPLFVLFLLFDSTRGLFHGWLRAAAGFALVPLFAILALVVQLALLQPELDQLADSMAQNRIDLASPTAILALVMIFAMVSTGVAIAGFVIAAGFRWTYRRSEAIATASSRGAAAPTAPTPALDRTQQSPLATQDRATQIAAAATAMSRREARLSERLQQRDTVVVAGVTADEGRERLSGAVRRIHLDQRRSAQPRRGARNSRRDS